MKLRIYYKILEEFISLDSLLLWLKESKITEENRLGILKENGKFFVIRSQTDKPINFNK